MPTPIGLTTGAAYKHNFQSDIENLHKNELLDMKARQDAEAKAQLLGDKLKLGTVYDNYNGRKLKEFATQKFKELGAWVDQNPDYQVNPLKWAQFNSMTTELQDNDYTRNSAKAKMNYDAMLDFINKNPNMLNNKRLKENLDKWNRYKETGNASLDGSTQEEFTFVPPTPYVDLNKNAAEIGKFFEGKTKQMLPGLGLGAYEETIDPDEMNEVATSFYNTHKEQIDDETQGGNGLEYAKNLIRKFVKLDFNQGDYNALMKQEELKIQAYVAKMKAEAEAKGEEAKISSYDLDIVQRPAGTVPVDYIKEAVSSGAKATVLSKQGGAMVTADYPVDYNGEFFTVDAKTAINRYNIAPYYTKQSKGVIKLLKGKIKIPVENAEEMGIIDPDFFFADYGRDDIAPDFKNYATKIQSPDGEDKDYVSVDVVVPFDWTSSGNANLYNKYNTVSSNVPGTKPVQGQATLIKTVEDEKGEQWSLYKDPTTGTEYYQSKSNPSQKIYK